MKRQIKRFGWTPDLPDQRDFRFLARPAMLRQLPKKVDLAKQMPIVYDQGNLGSCTANAIGAAFQFCLLKQNPALAFMPSRLFIYYNERIILNTIQEDSGAMIRDGFKTINKQGVCPETMLPYHIAKFTQKPETKCYKEAEKHQAISYNRVTRNLNQMKACLAEGFPFVFGFSVYESFESTTVAKTGKVNLPKQEESNLGGHAVLAVGYDENTKRFIVRNSWGDAWGKKGYFTMPYDYLLNENLADDFWTVRLVEENTVVPKTKKKVK
ncbi:MAG: C1 family peptidase [Chitinophagales bacterium]